MVGHKLTLNILKKKAIMQSIFPNHNKVRNQLQKENWKIHTFVEINAMYGSKKKSHRKLQNT